MKNEKKNITALATKVSEVIFQFHVIGFSMNAVYNSNNGTLVFTDADNGEVLNEVEDELDIDYSSFCLMAKNMLLDMIDDNLLQVITQKRDQKRLKWFKQNYGSRNRENFKGDFVILSN